MAILDATHTGPYCGEQRRKDETGGQGKQLTAVPRPHTPHDYGNAFIITKSHQQRYHKNTT